MPTIFFLHLGKFQPAKVGIFQPAETGEYSTGVDKSENYGVTYREAQEAIETEIPGTFDARTRAYLLLKRHGQTLCKRSNPKCDHCPVTSSCAYFVGKRRGRSTSA